MPTAALSRQLGCTRTASLVLNLPRPTKSSIEPANETGPSGPHAVGLIAGPYLNLNNSLCVRLLPNAARLC